MNNCSQRVDAKLNQAAPDAADAERVDDALSRHQADLKDYFPLPNLTWLHSEAQARANKRRKKCSAITAALSLVVLTILGWLDPAYYTQTLVTAIG